MIKNILYNKSIYLYPNFGTSNPDNKSDVKNGQVKIAPLIGSIIGTGISTAYAISRTPKSENLLKKISKTDFASTKNIFVMAIGSMLGGFIGGSIKDKGENKWEKIKEANFQLLSNVALPLIFLNLFKLGNDKLTYNSGKIVKNIGNFVSVFGGVAIGAVVGSKIAAVINNKIKPQEEYKRELEVKDFLIHVDDLPIALAFAGIPYIDKLIPFILISRGYDVGTK